MTGWDDADIDVNVDSDSDSDVGSDGDSDADVDRAPICPYCGVTALPSAPTPVLDPQFVCENADCEAFGEPV